MQWQDVLQRVPVQMLVVLHEQQPRCSGCSVDFGSPDNCVLSPHTGVKYQPPKSRQDLPCFAFQQQDSEGLVSVPNAQMRVNFSLTPVTLKAIAAQGGLQIEMAVRVPPGPSSRPTLGIFPWLAVNDIIKKDSSGQTYLAPNWLVGSFDDIGERGGWPAYHQNLRDRLYFNEEETENDRVVQIVQMHVDSRHCRVGDNTVLFHYEDFGWSLQLIYESRQEYHHMGLQVFYVAITSPAAGKPNPYRKANGLKRQTWRTARRSISAQPADGRLVSGAPQHQEAA